MTNSVQVLGLEQLESNIAQLNKKVAKVIIVDALKAGAVIIRDEARLRAPMGTVPHKFKERGAVITVKPGNLKKKIKEKKRTGRNVSMGTIQYIIPLDGRAFYGRFQEWGWKAKGGRYIPGKRFLESAYQAKDTEALDEISKLLGEGIEQAAQQLSNQNAH